MSESLYLVKDIIPGYEPSFELHHCSEAHCVSDTDQYGYSSGYAVRLIQRDENIDCWLDEIASNINLPSEACSTSEAAEVARIDNDGDLDPPRQHRQGFYGGGNFPDYFVVRHQIKTPIHGVGLQVWRGALLLCDLVLALGDRLKGVYALELGSGTGITCILLSYVAKRVFATDIGEEVLDNCEWNMRQTAVPGVFHTRELEWTETLPWLAPEAAGQDEQKPLTSHRRPTAKGYFWDPKDRYFWLPKDVTEVKRVRLLLAADVVYDYDSTAAFLQCAKSLMLYIQSQGGGKPVLFVAVEKRFNFMIHDSTARAHAYEHFTSLLKVENDFYSDPNSNFILKGRRLPVYLLPHILEYVRTSDLELWMLTLP